MKKLVSFSIIIFSVVSLAACKPNPLKKDQANQQTQAQNNETEFVKKYLFNKVDAVKDKASREFTQDDAFALTSDMKIGWNLGNTLDATGSYDMKSELSWGRPYTTKKMIDGLAASGIKTIRIPVSWHNHITDRNTYTISPDWMARVKKIVDWAIEDGMYVIINLHHDNGTGPGKLPKAGGYYPNSTNLAESQRYLYNVWGQIALAFNNGYDEHLVFETMNEPRLAGTECEWWYNGDSQCIDAASCLNKLNQTALDAIRESGGNNAKRFVMCPALQASENSAAVSRFKMPQDIDGQTGRLILSVHAYSPYSFAMESPGETVFTEAHKQELTGLMDNLKSKFIDKGYPVVIGEYGATNKENLNERIAWFSFYLSTAKKYGIPCMLWDNGVWMTRTGSDGKPDYSETYGYYDRLNQKWYFPEITEAMLKAVE